jgi:hypothetical protein
MNLCVLLVIYWAREKIYELVERKPMATTKFRKSYIT